MVERERFESPAVVRVENDEPNTVFNFMWSICGPHELEIHDRSDLRFRYSGNARPASNISFGYLEYGTPVTVHLGGGIENYSLSLPVRDRQTALNADGSAVSDVKRAIVLSPRRDIMVDIEGDCAALFVTIDRRLMDLELRRLVGSFASTPATFDAEMPLSASRSASWWRAARYYLREVSSGGGVASILCASSVGQTRRRRCGGGRATGRPCFTKTLISIVSSAVSIRSSREDQRSSRWLTSQPVTWLTSIAALTTLPTAARPGGWAP